MLDKYRLLGPSFDTISKLYSGDAVHACRLAMLRPDTLGPGSRVLFAGAGQGRDALHAAELGARVSVVDISPTMLGKFKQHLNEHPARATLAIEAIQSDALKVEDEGFYDMVVANFYLNIFERDKMLSQLKHLIKLLKPGGKLVIGDFAPPSGSLLNKSIQNLYWYTAATACFAAAGNAIHEIYNYAEILEKQGLQVKETKTFSVLGREMFCSTLAIK
ncbi:MAG: class I SAM-dependent methyltransferase [Oleiphilaceae bacterium]|nr:class I SAM-dependent methyltransferase [Oleiphilaceae bacterium]